MNKEKKIFNVIFGNSDIPELAFKDCGMLLYTLSKRFNWKSTYAHFKTKDFDVTWNKEFSSYVNITCIGETSDYKEQIKLLKQYLSLMLLCFSIMVVLFGNFLDIVKN